MVGREILGSTKVTSALVPASRTADASGDTIDLQGYEACLIIFQTGTLAGATTPRLLESDSSASGFTEVAAADLIGGAFTAAVASSVQVRAYKGSKRYIYLEDNHGDSSADLTAALYVLGNPRHVPTA